MLLEILADLGGAVLARQPMRARLGIALVRELLSLRQVVKHRLERLRRFGMRRELACELGARVLAPREEPQRPDLQLRERVRPFGLQTRRLAVAAALAGRQMLPLLVQTRLLRLGRRGVRRGALDAGLLADPGLDLLRQ